MSDQNKPNGSLFDFPIVEAPPGTFPEMKEPILFGPPLLPRPGIEQRLLMQNESGGVCSICATWQRASARCVHCGALFE